EGRATSRLEPGVVDPKKKAAILQILFPHGMSPEVLSCLPEIEEHLSAIMALTNSSKPSSAPIRDPVLQGKLARRRGEHHHRSIGVPDLVRELSTEWQTVSELARRFGVTEQAMRYAIADLRERGIVLQTRDGESAAPGRKPTEYRTERSLNPV